MGRIIAKAYDWLKAKLRVFEGHHGGWLRSAPCGFALGIGAILVGTIGSLATNDIRYYLEDALDTFAWQNGSGHPPNVPRYSVRLVVAFVESFLLFSVLALARQIAVDKQRIRDQQAFSKSYETLKELGDNTVVRVLEAHDAARAMHEHQPPSQFTERLNEELGAILFLHRLVTSHAVKEGLVRLILHSIAKLAKDLHVKPEGAAGANLMVFVDAAAAEFEAWREHLKFCGDRRKSLRGLLALPCRYSATSEDKAHDAKIPENVALPVPKDIGTEAKRWLVLPAAPLAFVRGKWEMFCPTSKIAKWCKDEGDFTVRVLDDIKAYFEHAGFRGVLSVPVFRYEDGRAIDTDEAIAVLNVHWYQTGSRLEVEFACKAFVEGIKPYLLLLGELLHERPELRPDDGAPPTPRIPSKPPQASVATTPHSP